MEGNTDQKDKADEKKEKEHTDNVQETKKSQKEASEEDFKEKFLRLAAEFDNYKKRIKIDMDSAKKIGKAELAKSLLPVLDEFELALIALNNSRTKKDSDAEENAQDYSIVKGIEIVYSNLIDTLKRNGIKEVDTSGKFDPYKHEIIMVKESEKEDGVILEVIKKGYVIDDVLIRPASVIISKKLDNKSTNEKKD
ncbi:MAG: nucleotide exchange factor GrpE [Candidatus Micrarchaeia archaeon]